MSESPVRNCIRCGTPLQQRPSDGELECSVYGCVMQGLAQKSKHKVPPTLRGAVLEEARKLTEGDRNRTHGDILSNHQAIADAWNWWLRHRGLLKEQEVGILPSDVAEMMSLLKKGRKVSGHAAHHDHGVDDCAYTAIAQELREMGH